MGKSEYQKVADAKKRAKKELFEKSWPKEDLHTPLLMIFAPKKESASAKAGLSAEDMLFQLLEGCMVLPCKIIVVSDTEPEDLTEHPAGKITWINTEDGRNKSKIDHYLLAADMALVFEEHVNELKNIMVEGTVVIGHEKSPLLQNYHPNEETGNSFTYDETNPWSIFMALVRAHETYRFPYDWQNIVRGLFRK